MRKSIEYFIEEGKDKGKCFIITRMSAFAADEWARHFIKALAKIRQEINPEKFQLGIADISKMNFQLISTFKEEDAEALLTDLFNAVEMKRDPHNPLVEPAKILESDIADPLTLSKLQEKAFELHIDFFKKRRFSELPACNGTSTGEESRSGETVQLAEHVNLSRPMGDVLGAGIASLKDLQSLYDSEGALVFVGGVYRFPS